MKTVLKIFIISLFIYSCNDSKNIGLKAFDDSDTVINGLVSSSENLDEVVVTGSAIKSKSASFKTEKKLIKNGNISFETEDLEKTKANITALINKYGGYISSDSQNFYGNTKSINLSVRIPAQNFDSILSGISKNVTNFDNKDIRISDVTEQFLDLETRLKNKKELEKKYLDILKKAKSVKDILDVERELGKLREGIESAEGRLKYLQNQVSFSTLNINFYISDSNTVGFGSKIKDGFANGFENLKSFFIGLINVWPFVIIFIVLLIFIRKRLKKNT